MIARFEEFDPGALMQMSHHFCRKIRMTIQSRADGGAAERKLAQNVDRFFGAPLRISHLLSVTTKLLTEPDRSCVHQMGAPDLNDVVEFLRLARKRDE